MQSGATRKILRGILPVDYPEVSNSSILRSLQQVKEPYVVESAGWLDDTHPSVLRTRLVFTNLQRVVSGDEMKLALDVTSSELGGCPLMGNLLLYQTICDNGQIATYGHRPYFYFDYKSPLVLDLSDVFAAAMGRATTDVDVFMEKVSEAASTLYTINDARGTLTEMVKNGLLNKGVALKALGKLEKEGCKTMWDVVSALTAEAKGFRDLLRLRYEQAAGAMMGLMFPRAQTEDNFVGDKTPITVMEQEPLPIPQLAAPASP